MERTSFAPMQCSLAQTLEIVGDWWTPLILRDLFLGVDRFDELVENLGISRNLLTRRLAALVRRGLVLREPYLRRPVRNRVPVDRSGTRTRSDPRRYDRLGRSLGAPTGGRGDRLLSR